MIKKDHPFYLIKELIKDSSTYTLSRYIYLPDSVSDEREFFHIKGSDFNQKLISESLSSLNQAQELAFHSIVKDKYGKIQHIPMIDFMIEDEIDRDTYFRLKYILDKRIFNSLVFYSSGRSFHAYSTTLISNKEWKDFMGKLLLVNPSNGKNSIIDTRWIGHRLLSGYSTLRWSNNSGKYLKLPQKYELKF
ncbi:primase 1D-like protein [Acinetobacter nosocomialis]|uniref:primase 1D-like protein n=1 Tax=Acinetobacter nosocomialis TaxID=106654 RepID=UPI00125075FE|nr:hypothetical protein [Acinetobacter nosocomialis]